MAKVLILGFIVDPLSNDNIGFGVNYQNLSSSLIGNVKFAGTGEGVFKKYFDHQSSFELAQNVSAEENDFGIAICKALTLAGILLQLEIGTHKTLENFFGGGYEIIGLKDNQFILCDDIIFAFWFAQIDDEGVTLNPIMKFFKQSYDHNDILIIRTLEMKSPDQKNPMFLTIREDEIHYIAPIYREPTPQEKSTLAKPDLAASLLCSYVLVKSKKGIEILSKFDWSKNRQIPLRFVDDGNMMEMQVQAKYIEDILNIIQVHQ